jgi:acetolactate synthase-1/2/3 large subunit
MKLRQAIAGALRAEGIGTAFGVMGDGNMLLWSDLVDGAGIRLLNARTETGAMLMADGFRRAGGGLGVVTVTHGPGLASTAVGLGIAVAARAPILVIAGDVPRGAPNHVQAFPQEVFGSAMGAAVFSVRSASDGLPALLRAIQHVRAGNGPAVYSIAVDVQEETVDAPYVPSATLASQPAALTADEAGLHRVAALLASAQRPILLAGQGARSSIGAIEALAKRTGALLAATGPMRGAFDGSPADMGVLGRLSEPDVRPIAGEADLLVAFGASLNRFTLDFGAILPKARIALVTDRAPSAAFALPVDPIVLGDALDAAQDTAALEEARRDPLGRVEAMRGDLFDPRAVVRAAQAHFPRDRTEVVGVGHFGGWPNLYGRLGRGGRFIGPWEFGAIGVAVPAALGASLARPDRPVLAWEGDGSLLWSLGELDTLARTGARVTVIAMDDGAYGAEVWKLEKMGVSAANAQFPRRDLAAAASALGVSGHAPRDAAGLDAALAAAAAAEGPSLIHVPVDPSIRQEMF